MKQDAMRATGMSKDGQIGQGDSGATGQSVALPSDGANWAGGERDSLAQRFAERLSAAIDGEAPLTTGSTGGPAFASWTTTQKQDWSVYHLIGDALRSDDLAHAHRGGWDFAARFSARLAEEPTIVAPQRAETPWDDRRAGAAAAAPAGTVGDAFRHHERGAGQRGAAGQLAGWLGGRRRMPAAAAAAAAVVTLAWALTPGWHAGSSSTTAAPTTLASTGNWQRVNLGGDRDLDPYLAAHQEFASDRGSLGYVAYAGAGR
ncbi:RseA family anti-sigma factor [Robbsia sp. KACC 23696]|uniref:sigma-E factor negative regulatory protein n=1 Tax=Robbsia sp. KACC 23696 TaxID=3149231 RepID=UPI00325AA7DB